MKFVLGVDLGQAHDFTALALLERHVVPAATTPGPRGVPLPVPAARPVNELHCRHLERTRDLPYPKVAERVRDLLGRPELKGRTTLLVDATGVGRPVVDMLRASRLTPIAVTIHGGDTVTDDFGGYRVPKRDLVGVVSVLLQTQRLKFAKDLPLVDVLVKELQDFKVKIDPVTAHDSYGAWRDGQHDDLVLAVAVAAWFAERPRRGDSPLVSRSYPTPMQPVRWRPA